MDKKIANKMLNSHIIYCHKNLLNNKLYFGITSLKPIERWGYKNNKHFNRAIKYYGWDSFEHIIVKEGLPEACAKTLERILIYKYNTTNPNNGYNLTEGGEINNFYSSNITRACRTGKSYKNFNWQYKYGTNGF